MSQSLRAANDVHAPNDLDAWWMPFTANRSFKQRPRIVSRAKDMYYYTPDGRAVVDGSAGLWGCNAGHNPARSVAAIQAQAGELDFAPAFQFGHPKGFTVASRIAELAPGDLNNVFFCNSGSEAVDTALKIALAYWQGQGQGQRPRLIGRERGYHGVGFGGISVGGIVSNRRTFPQLNGTDHLRHTHDPARNAFVKGQPEHGMELAEDLERLVALHGAETIAACMVEPVAGSTGGLIPPKGYLERLREICTRHGILLIFDEVISGFGRLGAPFATDFFGVVPDLVTGAKGLTKGAGPMGAVFGSRAVHDALMQGPDGIELFHGYTYSGHPVACAAGLATLDIYREEGLLPRAADLADDWATAMHDLRGRKNVIDIRTIGLIAGVELAPRPDAPGKRAYDVFVDCFERGLLTRVTGDIIALSPPLIIERGQIGEIVDIL